MEKKEQSKPSQSAEEFKDKWFMTIAMPDDQDEMEQEFLDDLEEFAQQSTPTVTDEENAIQFAKWVISEGFRLVGYKWQLREERLFDNELYRLWRDKLQNN